MTSARTLFSQDNNGEGHANAPSSSDNLENQDNIMALVYPDGRVTNVKVRQKDLSPQE